MKSKSADKIKMPSIDELLGVPVRKVQQILRLAEYTALQIIHLRFCMMIRWMIW